MYLSLIPSINYRAQLISLRQSNMYPFLQLKSEIRVLYAQQKVARLICILGNCVFGLCLAYLLLRQSYLKISQYITKKSALMEMASQHHVNWLVYCSDNLASKRRDD